MEGLLSRICRGISTRRIFRTIEAFRRRNRAATEVNGHPGRLKCIPDFTRHHSRIVRVGARRGYPPRGSATPEGRGGSRSLVLGVPGVHLPFAAPRRRGKLRRNVINVISFLCKAPLARRPSAHVYATSAITRPRRNSAVSAANIKCKLVNRPIIYREIASDTAVAVERYWICISSRTGNVIPRARCLARRIIPGLCPPMKVSCSIVPLQRTKHDIEVHRASLCHSRADRSVFAWY